MTTRWWTYRICSQQRPLRQSEKKDREEAEHDAEEHDLARRYVVGSPFHENETASPDHTEQGKSRVSGLLHRGSSTSSGVRSAVVPSLRIRAVGQVAQHP